MTLEDLQGHSSKEITLGRYEIYARHGYIFKDESAQEYFKSKDWYKPTVSSENLDKIKLNEIEQYNVDFIQQLEN